MRQFFVALILACALAPPSAAQVVPSADAAARKTGPDKRDIVVTADANKRRSAWLRLESEHFTIYSTDESEARKAVAKLEQLDQLIALLTNTHDHATPAPLAVYLVNGTPQLERLRRQYPNPQHFFTGYYSAAPTGMLVAADMFWDNHYYQEASLADGWLFTEYARHFLLQHARGAYLPSWYVDGLTLYFSTVQFHAKRLEYGRINPTLVRQLDYEKWEPIERIVSGEVAHGDEYSAESTLLVHFILADPKRARAFERFVAAIRRGEAAVPAFKAAFGMTMGRLQSVLWRYHYDTSFVQTTLTGYTPPPIGVAQLPKSADTLLLDDAAMRTGIVEQDRQRAVLARAEAAAAQYADPFATRVLARARILYGKPEQADALLARLLEKTPQDAELLYLQGLRHLMTARADVAHAPVEYRVAKTWFARAYQAEPDYYPALYGWVESLSPEPQFASDNSVNVLMKAAKIAPQATQIRVSAAMLLMYRQQFSDAEGLLAPIIMSTRNPSSGQVQDLLAKVRAHAQPTMDDVLASFRYTQVWKDLNCC